MQNSLQQYQVLDHDIQYDGQPTLQSQHPDYRRERGYSDEREYDSFANIDNESFGEVGYTYPSTSGSCVCAQNLSNRLLFSRTYLVFYAFVILVQLFLMIYLFRKDLVEDEDYEPELWFIILDLSAISIMVAEVCLRMMSRGKAFYSSKLNILDMVVICLCVAASLASYLIHLEMVVWKWREALVISRCLLQAVRVVFMLRSHIQRQKLVVKDQDKVVFTRLPSVGGFEGYEESHEFDTLGGLGGDGDGNTSRFSPSLHTHSSNPGQFDDFDLLGPETIYDLERSERDGANFNEFGSNSGSPLGSFGDFRDLTQNEDFDRLT